MKKTLLAILLLITALVGILLFMKKPKQEKINIEKIQFEYTSNMSVLPFQNTFLIYDGKKLIRKSDNATDIFSVRLLIDNYSIKTYSEYIYILDKTEKILYKLNKNGEIINQVKFVESAQNIYPLKNSDVIVQYSTGVNTDGIIVFDKDLKKKKDINYPNGLINTVAFEEGVNNIFVSVQLINDADIINAIYIYDSKYEVQSINQYKNLITMSLETLGTQKLILDPNALYIMDKDFKSVSKITAQSSFEKMTIASDKIYLQDGSKTVRIFDKSGKLLEEKNFKEPITNILSNLSQVNYISKGNVYSNKKEITVQEDIDKSILLSNNKLILFFRGGIRIIDIPY